MAELRNTFSWSFSAAEDFAECRRRRYWAKYAMWGGWSPNATARQQAAYRLTKMENRHALAGQAVEQAARWILRRKQEGRDADAEEAYETEARPFLLRRWQESKTRAWRVNPKKHCCLHEHYYHGFADRDEKEIIVHLREHIKRCLANFIASTLPRLAEVRSDQELPVATAADGDPESFEFEGVKVYAIPDYVYRVGEVCHIHDWKSGRESDRHAEQVRLYGLWAHLKHGVRPDQCQTHLEYLARGEVRSAELSEADLEAAAASIRLSVEEMTEYLENGDRARNEPLPMEDWELAATREPCRLCNFLELCAPELETPA